MIRLIRRIRRALAARRRFPHRRVMIAMQLLEKPSGINSLSLFRQKDIDLRPILCKTAAARSPKGAFRMRSEERSERGARGRSRKPLPGGSGPPLDRHDDRSPRSSVDCDRRKRVTPATPGRRKRGTGAEPILDASGTASAAAERREASVPESTVRWQHLKVWRAPRPQHVRAATSARVARLPHATACTAPVGAPLPSWGRFRALAKLGCCRIARTANHFFRPREAGEGDRAKRASPAKRGAGGA